MSDNNNIPRPALQVQQDEGAAAATSRRATTVVSWASSTIGRAVLLLLLVTAGLLIRGSIEGFWNGVIAGFMILMVGWLLSGAKKNASPAIKSLIWGWPQIFQAVGLLVFLSVWLFSGTAKNIDKSFTQGDLHAACDAADFDACVKLKALNLEKAKARAALADAYGRTPAATASTGTTGTTTVIAPPPVPKPAEVRDCVGAPDVLLECKEVTLYRDGESYVRVGPSAHCARFEPDGIATLEQIIDPATGKKTATVELKINPHLHAGKVEVRTFFLPLGGIYKNFTCG